MLSRARVLATAAAGACAAAHAAADDKKRKDIPTPKSMSELMTSLALKQRHVFLSGHIDDESAKLVIAQLLWLELHEPGVPISLNINSSGGKVHAGFAIHDVMNSISSPVHTTCLGHCESMAAVLLAAGQQGQRVALQNCRVMIHQPTRTPGASSKTSKQLAISAAETEKSRVKLATLLSRCTGRPFDEIALLLEQDQYYSATEACELGLVDAVGNAQSFCSPCAAMPNADTEKGDSSSAA